MEIKIEDYQLTQLKDTDEYKELQQQCYTAARNGTTVELAQLPAPEYKYFSELYLIYKGFTSGQIGEEDAKKKERELYNEYCQNDRDRITYTTNIAFWNNNIRLASTSLNALLKATDEKKALDFALDIVEKLLNNTIIKKTVYEKLKR